MTNRMAWVVWVGVAACGAPSPESVCERIREVTEGCATGSGTTYSYTDSWVDECASNLEDCSDDDLKAIDNYVDCVADACDDSLDCVEELDGVDLLCLGYTGSGTTSYPTSY